MSVNVKYCIISLILILVAIPKGLAINFELHKDGEERGVPLLCFWDTLHFYSDEADYLLFNNIKETPSQGVYYLLDSQGNKYGLVEEGIELVPGQSYTLVKGEEANMFTLPSSLYNENGEKVTPFGMWLNPETMEFIVDNHQPSVSASYTTFPEDGRITRKIPAVSVEFDREVLFNHIVLYFDMEADCGTIMPRQDWHNWDHKYYMDGPKNIVFHSLKPLRDCYITAYDENGYPHLEMVDFWDFYKSDAIHLYPRMMYMDGNSKAIDVGVDDIAFVVDIPTLIDNLAIDQETPVMEPESTLQLSASWNRILGTEESEPFELRWSSSNPEIATIDPATGLVESFTEGETEISVTTDEGSDLVATVTLKVAVGSGIDSIETEGTGQVEYYTLQGVRISRPTSTGIYLRHSSTGTEKLVIKNRTL